MLGGRAAIASSRAGEPALLWNHYTHNRDGPLAENEEKAGKCDLKIDTLDIRAESRAGSSRHVLRHGLTWVENQAINWCVIPFASVPSHHIFNRLDETLKLPSHGKSTFYCG
jgi:hypothetical protein